MSRGAGSPEPGAARREPQGCAARAPEAGRCSLGASRRCGPGGRVGACARAARAVRCTAKRIAGERRKSVVLATLSSQWARAIPLRRAPAPRPLRRPLSQPPGCASPAEWADADPSLVACAAKRTAGPSA